MQSTRVVPPRTLTRSGTEPSGRLAIVITASSPSWTAAPFAASLVRRRPAPVPFGATPPTMPAVMSASRAAAAGVDRALATTPTVPDAKRVNGATPTEATVLPLACADRATTCRANCELPAVAARTPASVGASRTRAVPGSFTVVPEGRSRASVNGAPSTDLTSGAKRRPAGGVRSTTVATTGGEIASGLSTRSSASEPKVGGAVRSPRNDDVDVGPVPLADITRAARVNRPSVSGLPSAKIVAASRSVLAATTRASVAARFVTNGNGLRPVSGSSIWW